MYSHRIFERQANALIRLRKCAGWSEPLLVAHITLLEISRRASILSYGGLIVVYGCSQLISHDMTKPTKIVCAPSQGLDQPGYLPSQSRVFSVRSVSN